MAIPWTVYHDLRREETVIGWEDFARIARV